MMTQDETCLGRCGSDLLSLQPASYGSGRMLRSSRGQVRRSARMHMLFVQIDGSLDIARLTFMQTSFSGHLLFGLQMRALAEMENSGVVSLLEGDKYEDLQRMYLLFKRVDGGLDLARSMLSEHLKSSGKALIMDPERTKEPVEFVHRLLTEKDKYDR